MLLFLISLLSFLLFLSKSLPLQPLPLGASEMRLLSVLLCKESLFVLLRWLRNSQLIATDILRIASRMSTKRNVVAKSVVVEETAEMSVIDLPELVLECILSRLPPAGLCNMASVCRSMKDMCRSDHLWKMHMEEKWGRVIGAAARREWQCYVASRGGTFGGSGGKTKGLIGILPCVWPLNWLQFKFHCGRKSRSSLPLDSIMSWYLSLESGKFWFPAQVYNRENGHVGFMLSCYDAEVSYDCHTNTFRARYPPHGRRTIVVEDGVQWDRVRTPPVEIAAHDLHVSDCLTELRPGDHIEIQWRRIKEFPYGWWYGVVNHLETCDGSGFHCHCHKNDTVVLEFNQYATGSRWRRTTLNRKDHREEGNETDGFYGGIRRLQSKEEIYMWRKLWPIEVLE